MNPVFRLFFCGVQVHVAGKGHEAASDGGLDIAETLAGEAFLDLSQDLAIGRCSLGESRLGKSCCEDGYHAVLFHEFRLHRILPKVSR